MEILRAESLGMCFGVRDALAQTEGVGEPETVTIHGELVHNETVLSRLDQRGFHRVPESDRESLPGTPRVLVTAHGISERRRRWLEGAGHELIDTTCPLVTHVHHTARDLQAEGYFVVIIGKPGHVEVQGIVEDLDDYAVVAAPSDIRSYSSPRIGIVSQTTFLEEKALEIVEEISRHNPGSEIRWVDTICEPTKRRTRAVRDLASRVEVMVVIGGRHSNNTRRLVEIARSASVPTYHIQGPEDVEPEWFEGISKVGLTAGTSTLGETVDSVENALRQIAGRALRTCPES